MYQFKRTPEARLNSALVREYMGRLLKDHYQAYATDKLPPRLQEVLKKLDEERPNNVTGETKDLS